MREAAIVLGDELLRTPYGKTAHGLLRKSDRFQIVGVVEAGIETGASDAGTLIGGASLGIPLTGSVEAALAVAGTKPVWAIVGIATPGGKMSPTLRSLVLVAARNGLSIVNGLHDLVADDGEIAAAVARHDARILDIRKIKKPADMSYWTGKIYSLATPRIAVLGTDCIVGKRTTAYMLVSALRERAISAELIYTGQTGWLQGANYGFVLDATINDFITGELEAALFACASERRPDVMIIEGQSSMQNPSTPSGAEIIVSGDVQGVVLQHVPGRKAFCGYGNVMNQSPSLETEIALISAYNVPLLGISLNFSEFGAGDRESYIADLSRRYNVAVVAPFSAGLEPIVDVIAGLIANRRGPV
jgi:uncharacterized NAD-dependent epimerase/dehydratase family protein